MKSSSYITRNFLLLPSYKYLYTDWVPASSTQPAATHQLAPVNEGFSSGPDMILILGAGIQYGMPAPDVVHSASYHAGAARIMCVRSLTLKAQRANPKSTVNYFTTNTFCWQIILPPTRLRASTGK
jgi:hypothetical protein